MSELAGALKTLGAIREASVIKYPTGRWGFVGSVPAHLAYLTEDGQRPTVKQFQNAAIAGPRIAGLVTRTWETEAAALESQKTEKEI